MYLGRLVFGLLCPALLQAGIIIADFESTTGWNIGGGPGANLPGSSITLSNDAQVGLTAGLFTYAHTTAQGFDYVDLYNDTFNLDLTSTVISLYLKGNNPAPDAIALQIYSTNGGYLEYVFSSSELDGTWQALNLPLASFTANNTPDLSQVNLIRFRAFGDATATDYTGTLLLDQIVATSVPEPGTLAMAGLALLGVMRAGSGWAKRRSGV